MSAQFAAFLASNIFLVPVWSPPMLDGFGIGVVNGSLWTIPVEVSFYAVVPLIVVLAVRRSWRTMIFLVMGIAFAAVLIYGVVGATTTDSLPWKRYGVTFFQYLWWFAVGIAWARLWPKVRQRGWIAAVSFVLYFVLAKLPLEPGATFVANAVVALPLSYAVIWFGCNGPRVLTRFAARLGDLSFSVYIWHMIVVNFLVTWGARNWPVDGTVLVLGMIAATTMLAYASWHLVERPALARKRYSSGNGGNVTARAEVESTGHQNTD